MPLDPALAWYSGDSQEFARTGISMQALCKLHRAFPTIFLLKYHLYTFQQTFNTYAEQTSFVFDGHSQWDTGNHFFSAVGTPNQNKEHWLSCSDLLVLYVASLNSLFPPFT